MNASQADILVYGNGTTPLAVVEVKNIGRLSLPQAMNVREALIESEAASATDSYILVVSQESGYLWKPMQAGNDDGRPDARFDMRDVLRDYLTDRELDGHLRGAELELAILQWLSDLSRGRGRVPSEESSMADLANAIRGARIEGGARL
jgi:hypothetical protein